MKNLILITFLILFTNALLSQSVDGTDLIDIRNQYIKVELRERNVSNFMILVDFGQQTKINKIKNQELLDQSGESVRVNSPIDALNLMHKYGYEVQETYGEDDCSYLLRRRKDFASM